MRTGGTEPIPRASNAEGVNFEEGKKGYSDYANDPEFQAWLESTGNKYNQEYSGEALHPGGGSGSVRKALGDTPFAEQAVNPELLPMESGYAKEKYGFTSPGAARSTRGGQMQKAADMFRNNRQMEVDYEAWLAKQKQRPGPAQPKYEVIPGGRGRSDSFRVTGG
tara:strand:- start:694 stop:1188 length:495 start_codon:yes stop_codon:yes gene_type:complete